MTPTYLQLLEHLQVVRRSWRIRQAMEGGLLALSAALLLLGTLMLCDQVGQFGRAGRFVLALILWIGVAGLAWRLVLRGILAAHSDNFFAALIERALPLSRNRFINALQLGREEKPATPRIIEAIVNEGATVADELDPAQAVAGPRLRRHAILMGIALIIAAVYSLAAGPAAMSSLARILLPAANIAPFTRTQLVVTPDRDLHLLEGTPLTVTAKTTGRVPQRVTVHWESAGRTRSARMKDAGRDAYRYTFASLTSDTAFTVRAGDARSPRVRVTVDPMPRIESMSVTYEFPAYTARKPESHSAFDGHLRGLPQTVATLRFQVNKPLETLRMTVNGADQIPTNADDDHLAWTARLTLTRGGSYRISLKDTQSYQVEVPTLYSITLDRDEPPSIAFAKPAADLERRPEEEVDFAVIAQDDLGLADVTLRGIINDADESVVLSSWPLHDPQPLQRAELTLQQTVSALGLKAGDRMQYWAEAVDRNAVAPEGPGRAVTRRFTLVALTAEQAKAALDQQLSDYAQALEELIRLQRLNRSDTAGFKAAADLLDRQTLIRRMTARLADAMESGAFPARSATLELRNLTSGPMARVIALFEGYRDTKPLDVAKASASSSLPVQDEIITSLEALLIRLTRTADVRRNLKKMQHDTPKDSEKVLTTLDKLAKDLEAFLSDVRDLDQTYERLAKRDKDDITSDDLDALDKVEQRKEQWQQWFKDSVDAITKLPQGFVADSYLADSLTSILEEVEKKPRKPTIEIATPLEEGAKALGTEMMEDLEMWMPDRADSVRWVMEDPAEGIFEVPEMTLSSDLQDIIGNLIEDMEDFDEGADDVTGAWGGNIQMGWDIADGPISTFNAGGKTGNQLPNSSEMTGRSGDGRRGRSSGQMVGDTARGMEGRPTPARVSNEPYQDGVPKTLKQLDPNGATGGGRKTGGGQRGLQGGTPPDLVKDMDRLAANQAILRERAQKVASRLDPLGRPAAHVMRSIQLIKGAEADSRDQRYDDAARKRKLAIGELRAARSPVDQAIGLSLQKATFLPADMRGEISAGAQQALPEGYEDIVGAYYQALSTAGAADGDEKRGETQ